MAEGHRDDEAVMPERVTIPGHLAYEMLRALAMADLEMSPSILAADQELRNQVAHATAAWNAAVRVRLGTEQGAGSTAAARLVEALALTSDQTDISDGVRIWLTDDSAGQRSLNISRVEAGSPMAKPQPAGSSQQEVPHEDDEVGPLTDADWQAARRSLGGGSKSTFFGTSTKVIDDALKRLSRSG